MGNLATNQIIHSCIHAGQALRAILSDSKLLNLACVENPWYTPFYLKKAGEGLMNWINEKSIQSLLNRYPPQKDGPKKIAVIMAANLPFVGFQDLFHVFLSGNICLYRFSTRDTVMMNALLQGWIKIAPEIQEYLLPFEKNAKADFVVATGGDNTARYTDFQFQNLPRLIRKNRFSIGKITGNETENDLQNLASDILLFNGMGCRNVSNLIVPPHYDYLPLLNVLDNYPDEKLSELWKERMRWECAIAEIIPAKSVISKNAILNFSDELKTVSPGYLNVVECNSGGRMLELFQQSIEKIQCIVGEKPSIPFGTSQEPALDDFADGVDLIAEFRRVLDKKNENCI